MLTANSMANRSGYALRKSITYTCDRDLRMLTDRQVHL